MTTRTRNPASASSVLVVSHYFPPHVGGVEAVAWNQARQLARAGLTTRVLTTAHGVGVGVSSDEGVEIHRMASWNRIEDTTGVSFPVPAPGFTWRAWSLVRRCDVALIHDPLYLTSWIAAALCLVTSTPYILIQHVGLVAHSNPLVMAVQRAVRASIGRTIVRRAAHVVPISEFVADSNSSYNSPLRTTVVRNGVDVDRYRPSSGLERRQLRADLGLPQDERLVLFVGRFVPKKGFDLVASARSDSYRLVFVGGDRPADLPRDPRLLFLGALPTDRVAEVYRAVDVYVGASRGETPLATMEAMASGLPTLLIDDPAFRRVMGNATDRGFDYFDGSPTSLRASLEMLLASPATTASMRREARDLAVSQFDWKTHVEQLQRIWEHICDG